MKEFGVKGRKEQDKEGTVGDKATYFIQFIHAICIAIHGRENNNKAEKKEMLQNRQQNSTHSTTKN